MTTAALHAAAFYSEVAKTRTVWTIRDKEGFPAPLNSDGKRAMPFWSSESRVKKFFLAYPGYAHFDTASVDWDAFSDHWIPGLKKDGLLVGVNWTGERASGYDLDPEALKRNVETLLKGS